jgi:sugar phosphate isomerase/epimerase
VTPLPPPAAEVAALGREFGPAVRRAAVLGFTCVVVEARARREAEDLDALADAGVLVSGASLGAEMPAGCSLDAAAVEPRRQALYLLQEQVADAARLGVTWAYLAPGSDATAPGDLRFIEAVGMLAAFAARRKVRLCLGHGPETCFPHAWQTLAWLQRNGPAEAGLALDVAVCRRGGEDPHAVAAAAGNFVGCVRLAAEALTPTEVADLAALLRQDSFAGGIALGLDDLGTDEAALAAAKALWDSARAAPQP